MKLIGSYTSPFVRKISVILLEKRIPFEFVNESPYSESNGVARYNPLGKVPALVTDDGECWFDSPVIAQYLELLGVAPPMIPADPRAALRMRHCLPELSPGGAGLVRHPAAVGEVGGCAVPARQLCAHRTAADLTQAGNSLRKEALQSPLIVDSLSRREGGK